MTVVISQPDNSQALAAPASQSTRALLTIVQNHKPLPFYVRKFEDELKALGKALDSLISIDLNLSPLSLPLQECHTACNGFGIQITECTSQDGGGSTDWAKPRYLGHDIKELRYLLAAYTSTFNIALSGPNLHRLSSADISSHRILLGNAATDLNEQLANVTAELEAKPSPDTKKLLLNRMASLFICIEFLSASATKVDRILESRRPSMSSDATTIFDDATIHIKVSSSGNAVHEITGEISDDLSSGLSKITLGSPSRS